MVERNEKTKALETALSQIEKSFGKVSKGNFYEVMKGWAEADKIMREYRRGSSDSHGLNTLFEKNASCELERKAYANTKTGAISNAYIVDQFGSVSAEALTRSHTFQSTRSVAYHPAQP
jgi:hypothetical protein